MEYGWTMGGTVISCKNAEGRSGKGIYGFKNKDGRAELGREAELRGVA